MLVDLTPQELLAYQGSSPRPEDFDDYWSRALAELDAVDPQLELVPAKFHCPGCECFDLWFTGVRGARVHAKYIRPANVSGKHPAVVQFHGYSGSAGDWRHLLCYVQAGMSIAAIDCRGQGGLSEDVGGVRGNTLHGHIIRGLDDDTADNLLFRHIFLDCAELTRIVMAQPEVDASRVGVTGGSQGGGLTFATASLVPEIKTACAVFPFLSDYKRVWLMDMDERAYEELKEYLRHTDPYHEHVDETFRRLGYIDIQNLAPRIRARFKMWTGLMDNVCPPSTQFAAFNKITSEKEYVFCPDFGHEDIPRVNDDILEMMIDTL